MVETLNPLISWKNCRHLRCYGKQRSSSNSLVIGNGNVIAMMEIMSPVISRAACVFTVLNSLNAMNSTSEKFIFFSVPTLVIFTEIVLPSVSLDAKKLATRSFTEWCGAIAVALAPVSSRPAAQEISREMFSVVHWTGQF